MVFPKLRYLQSDMQSKNAWRKEPRRQIFCVQQASGELRPLSVGRPAELQSQGSTFREDVFPVSCCMWEQVSEPLIYPLHDWRLEKKGKNFSYAGSLFFFCGNTKMWQINMKEKYAANKNENLNYISTYRKLFRHIVPYIVLTSYFWNRVCTGAMKITHGKWTF